jgi:hypothetical protein
MISNSWEQGKVILWPEKAIFWLAASYLSAIWSNIGYGAELNLATYV